jgi:hypothetical protein
MNRAVLERAALSRIYITGGYTDLLFSETTSRVWPTNLGRGCGTGLRICRHRGQRTAWPQSMASCSGRRRGSDSEDLWIYDPLPRIVGMSRVSCFRRSLSTSP